MKPIKKSYNAAAADFEAHASKSPHNAYADRPTLLAMLPDLDGLNVLDAGCGTGLYCGELLDRGAVVTAFDPAAEMVEIAREKYGDRVSLSVHTIEQLSDRYEAASFDLVLSALVIDHVPDLELVFTQIDTVLKPGGHLVCSFSHPFSLHQSFGETYHAEEPYTAIYPNVGLELTGYRRPLESYIRPLLSRGYTLVDLVETKPTEECRTVHPEAYEKMMRKPTMMAIKWGKPA